MALLWPRGTTNLVGLGQRIFVGERNGSAVPSSIPSAKLSKTSSESVGAVVSTYLLALPVQHFARFLRGVAGYFDPVKSHEITPAFSASRPAHSPKRILP